MFFPERIKRQLDMIHDGGFHFPNKIMWIGRLQ